MINRGITFVGTEADITVDPERICIVGTTDTSVVITLCGTETQIQIDFEDEDVPGTSYTFRDDLLELIDQMEDRNNTLLRTDVDLSEYGADFGLED